MKLTNEEINKQAEQIYDLFYEEAKYPDGIVINKDELLSQLVAIITDITIKSSS